MTESEVVFHFGEKSLDNIAVSFIRMDKQHHIPCILITLCWQVIPYIAC